MDSIIIKMLDIKCLFLKCSNIPCKNICKNSKTLKS